MTQVRNFGDGNERTMRTLVVMYRVLFSGVPLRVSSISQGSVGGSTYVCRVYSDPLLGELVGCLDTLYHFIKKFGNLNPPYNSSLSSGYYLINWEYRVGIPSNMSTPLTGSNSLDSSSVVRKKGGVW